MNVLDRDFFTDPGIIRDPSPYYTALHERGPVVREPHHGVFMVSGLEEVLALFADVENFSSIVAPLGPFMKLPTPAEGESLADVIERRRACCPPSTLPGTRGSGRCSTSSSRRTASRRTRSSCGASPTG